MSGAAHTATLADRWRAEKPATFADVAAYVDLLEELDPASEIRTADGAATIVFSDGSTHVMGPKQ
ncbi:hypothetical protein LOC51_00660 [Rubrivivax sp. JA1024]|nr:hypothetical protein [Rubrivivax sp. JA1024]